MLLFDFKALKNFLNFEILNIFSDLITNNDLESNILDLIEWIGVILAFRSIEYCSGKKKIAL